MKIGSSIPVVITGGASNLGTTCAQVFISMGAKVAIFDINAVAGEAIIRRIGEIFCPVDVTSDKSVDKGFSRARGAYGQERILVNCTGTGNAIKTASRSRNTSEVRHFPLSEFDRVMQFNLVDTFRCIAKSADCMLTLQPLDEGERGVIVNTASVQRRMVRLDKRPILPQREVLSE